MINRENLEINGKISDMELFLRLGNISDDLIFIHPVLSLFFDKLTVFQFIHNEILVSSDLHFDTFKNIIVNRVLPPTFKIFKTFSLHFKVSINGTNFKFKCLSPEFGVIWILQHINSMSVGIALGLLEFCDINVLNSHQNLFPSKNVLKLILELGETFLNRYDLIWQIIEKYDFENELSDLPLFLDKNIRIERRYEKIR